jgi:hypothetical protein
MKLERLENIITISHLSNIDYEIILNIVPTLLSKYGYKLELSNDSNNNSVDNSIKLTFQENYLNLSGFSKEIVRKLYDNRKVSLS